MNKNKHYDWSLVQNVYNQLINQRATMLHFGISRLAWAKAIRRGDLLVQSRSDSLIPLDDLLVVGRLATNRSHLKQRLFKAGLLKPHCYECGLVDWRNKALPLELDHINGDKYDNRLENLRILCPNCHAQQPTNGGKNKRCQIR